MPERATVYDWVGNSLEQDVERDRWGDPPAAIRVHDGRFTAVRDTKAPGPGLTYRIPAPTKKR